MIITITGRAGAGKDSVIKWLELPSDYQVLDADFLGHECLKESSIMKRLEETFAGCVEGGVVNRKKLGLMVFPHRVKDLNKIVHPCLIQKIKDKLTPNTVIHAALLHELKLISISDRVILVDSSLENTLQRISSRFRKKDILRRLRAQRSLLWYRQQADIIIKNNGTLNDLQQSVKSLCQTLF